MNRISFDAWKFPKFIAATSECDGWQESFSSQGYETYYYVYNKYPKHSLSNEEYTLFVLRWS